MVQISLQNSGGKVVFLVGSMEPPLPLGHQREWNHLGYLGVKYNPNHESTKSKLTNKNI